MGVARALIEKCTKEQTIYVTTVDDMKYGTWCTNISYMCVPGIYTYICLDSFENCRPLTTSQDSMFHLTCCILSLLVATIYLLI